MKTKYKILLFALTFIASFSLFILWAGGFTFLHRNFPWIPVPGYFRYTFMHEMEIRVKDEYVHIIDRDEAIRVFKEMGVLPLGFRLANFRPNEPIAVLGPYAIWASTDELISTGFHYTFEIVIRGRRNRELTLIPVNIGCPMFKHSQVLLYVMETEQIIIPSSFRLFFDLVSKSVSSTPS